MRYLSQSTDAKGRVSHEAASTAYSAAALARAMIFLRQAVSLSHLTLVSNSCPQQSPCSPCLTWQVSWGQKQAEV